MALSQTHQQTRTAAMLSGSTRWHIALGAALALLLCAGLLASFAQAAPVHPFLPGAGLGGFAQACGVAVDSEGNRYVADAAAPSESIQIFDSANVQVGSISNPNEPCGLAVNSKGQLFVSETTTGEVVRYKPDAFPLTATPSYGPREVIDPSGEALGIAVDPFDDFLYVAQGSRIALFNAEGTPGIDELQRIFTFGATAGTYRLIFKGQETAPIAFNAPPPEIQAALEALSTVGTGNVSVAVGPHPTNRDVTFKNALGGTNVEQLQANTSSLTGSISISTVVEGFDGHLLEGELTNATGVAAYTYKVSNEAADRYLFVTDDGATGDQVKIFGASNVRTLALRRTITGVDHDGNSATAEQKLGFGAEGAYLAADPGNRSADDKCTQAGDPPQACTAGHFFVYDDAHTTLEEFEATGEHLSRTDLAEADPTFSDGRPTAVAVERSGGPDDGTIYVAAATEVLAFAPLPAPSRGPLVADSFSQGGISGVAVDRFGTRYVSAGSTIFVHKATGKERLAIQGPGGGQQLATQGDVGGLAVDSECNVYAIHKRQPFDPEDSTVAYFSPQHCPPKAGTTYTASASLLPPADYRAVAVNPANDHVFVRRAGTILELESAAEGSAVLDADFASGLGLNNLRHIGVHGSSGNVYLASLNTVWVVDPGLPTATDDETVLARIAGGGSPSDPLANIGSIAVDQSNGHFVAFMSTKGIAQEFEASGAFVAQFPEAPDGVSTEPSGVAIDNSGGVTDGRAYLAINVGANTLRAFDRLTHGEPPKVATGTASEVDADSARLNGTVDPRGFEVSECHFEYLSEADYVAQGETFTAATSVPCEETAVEIGTGAAPVPVHAEITGVEPETTRYRFRVIAANKYGEDKGAPGLFGPPRVTPLEAQPIFYDEATLRAEVDPSGLETKYHFEYVGEQEFLANGFANAQSTPVGTLAPGEGSVGVMANLRGLTEGTRYRFRVVAENDAKAVQGAVGAFETLQRADAPPCPNDQFRIGPSAKLPDCRAYELVTPADTRGLEPLAADSGEPGRGFNNWLVTPRGPGAGESVAYFVAGTLPGYEGSAFVDGYRATRAEGDHPKDGWASELFTPSLRQTGNTAPTPWGVAADQRYWFWPVDFPSSATYEGMLPRGIYLRMPHGLVASQCNPEPQQDSFELIGCGSFGTDPNADGEFVAAGGTHVIFRSDVPLAPGAPPAGTEAIYDRAAGSADATVLSLLPDGQPPAAGEDAVYLAATEDGAAVAFQIGNDLYVRRAGEGTVKVADAPNSFAGFSEDGERIFYADADTSSVPGVLKPAGLYAFELDTGTATQVAPDSVFVNVSVDGSTVYFTSEEVLDDAEEGTAGAHNLYMWNGSEIRFVALLDPQDFVHFTRDNRILLHRWTDAVSNGQREGRALSPTRSTPDGDVFVFQSHAQLTAYDNTEPSAAACEAVGVADERCGEIYRYDARDESLRCVSCDPTGAPPTADAELQSEPPMESTTIIPNVTDDGRQVVFQSKDSLLPEDANTVIDVYQWTAQGAGGCKPARGCLALISTGQGDRDSHLFGMSADGHDVFFRTVERLHVQDIPGTSSLYDARVEGGIPAPPLEAICEGDACQGAGSAPPLLHAPSSTATGDGPVTERRCPKGRRLVKGRCVRKRCAKGKRRVKGRCAKQRPHKAQRNRQHDTRRAAR